MQFRLSTLFLLFVVLWSSLAVFGGGGIVVFIIVVLMAVSIVRPVYFLVLFGFLLLLGLLLPAISCAREAARRCACTNNIRQIALALLNYRQANGCFPPAYIADKNGQPAHSWRVLILPYLEGQTLYQQYNFNEPWDGPNNKKLLAGRPPMCFVCPSDGNIRISGTACTSYAAVVGADAAWPGKTSGKPTGDPSQTILLVEIAGADIEWTEPKDVSLDALLAKSPGCVTPSSKHLSNDEFFTYTPSRGSQRGVGRWEREVLARRLACFRQVSRHAQSRRLSGGISGFRLERRRASHQLDQLCRVGRLAGVGRVADVSGRAEPEEEERAGRRGSTRAQHNSRELTTPGE